MTQTFIKKHQYNFIKKSLYDLNSTFRGCIDPQIVATYKACIQEQILNLFTDLSEDQKTLLDLTPITESLHIDKYLEDLDTYVYGMPDITNAQISKVFKKEKKFKLPSASAQAAKKVYLGWVDPSLRKLFVVYNMNGKWIGMTCRIPNYHSTNPHMCALCNHVGDEKEVAYVSPVCKTAHDDYQSIGFNICLDSEQCNERILSTDTLEKLLKKVNNIK